MPRCICRICESVRAGHQVESSYRGLRNRAVTWHGIGQSDCGCELCRRCVRCRSRRGTHIGPWSSWYCATCYMAYALDEVAARRVMEGAIAPSYFRSGHI